MDPDLDFDQSPDDEPAPSWSDGYTDGAIKTCQAILMVIDAGGDLAAVQRVARGTIDQLEMKVRE